MGKLLLLTTMFIMVHFTTTFSQMNRWENILNVQYLFDMDIAPSGKIFVVSYTNGVWRSDDNGDHWIALSFPVSDLTAVNATPLGTVYVGTWGHGVYRSTNNGDTWIPTGSTTLKVNAISSNSDGDVFVSTFGDSALYRSTDNGLSWYSKIRGIPFQTSPIYIDEVITGAGGLLYAAGYKAYRSTNNGEDWSLIGPPYTENSICLLSTSPGHVFVGGDGGVQRTTNDGLTWETVNFGSAPQFVRALAVNSQGRIFRGIDDGGGVYYSDDEGDNWYDFNSGLTNKEVHDLAIDSRGFLFAATYEGGMFRTARSSVVSVNNDDPTIPRKVSLSQNYPNPFNPTTAISYQLIANSFVKLVVYDVLGREVSTLVDDVERAGTHIVRWEASTMPSGVYFYRLNARPLDNGQVGVFMEVKTMVLAK